MHAIKNLQQLFAVIPDSEAAINYVSYERGAPTFFCYQSNRSKTALSSF